METVRVLDLDQTSNQNKKDGLQILTKLFFNFICPLKYIFRLKVKKDCLVDSDVRIFHSHSRLIVVKWNLQTLRGETVPRVIRNDVRQWTKKRERVSINVLKERDIRKTPPKGLRLSSFSMIFSERKFLHGKVISPDTRTRSRNWWDLD